ncbi:MAG: hypothetical protein ACP5HK_02825 [Acidilobus sp.]
MSEDLEEVIVEYAGSRVRAYRDRQDGLLVCPICRRSKFTTPTDLLAHIVAHAKGTLEKRRQPPSRAHFGGEEEP